MIAGIFHKGSGLGNQLARYVMTRVLAKDLNLEFGMVAPENFKGSFMKLDMGKPVNFPYHTEMPAGKVVVETDWPLFLENSSDYNWAVKDIKDNTIIDGEFQGEKYFEHRLDEIREWLKVEPIRMWDNVCVINFRGGEYVGVGDLFLTKEYWDTAIEEMRKINRDMKFEVHTDDVTTAQRFFPDFVIKHDISLNWRSIRYAHYLIISNSSFAIIPALLNQEAKKIIAPKYWAGRNVGEWRMKQNEYTKFLHL